MLKKTPNTTQSLTLLGILPFPAGHTLPTSISSQFANRSQTLSI